VARRIELPSADVLFGDAPGKPPKAAAAPRTPAKAKAAGKPRTTASRKAAPAPATTKKAGTRASRKPTTTPRKTATDTRKPTTPRRRSTAEARLADVESRLPELPVEALIDLRDNLEDLLAADSLDEAAVRRLLDSVGA